MTAVCSHKGLTFPQWRLQCLRTLFCQPQTQRPDCSPIDPTTFARDRSGRPRNFTASRKQCRGRGRTGNKTGGTDVGALNILEQATRRCTAAAPPGVEPLIQSQPDTLHADRGSSSESHPNAPANGRSQNIARRTPKPSQISRQNNTEGILEDAIRRCSVESGGLQSSASSRSASLPAVRGYEQPPQHQRSAAEDRRMIREQYFPAHQSSSSRASGVHRPFSNPAQPAPRGNSGRQEFEPFTKSDASRRPSGDPSGHPFELNLRSFPAEQTEGRVSGTADAQPEISNRSTGDEYTKSPLLEAFSRTPSSRPGTLHRTSENGNERVLSHAEHSRMSALLESLRSTTRSLGPRRYGPISPELSGRRSFHSDSLPTSPFQSLTTEKVRKERPTLESRRRLLFNPWAQLLASPIRMCRDTEVKIPEMLMIRWSFVRNPANGFIYCMPEELTDMSTRDKRIFPDPLPSQSADDIVPQKHVHRPWVKQRHQPNIAKLALQHSYLVIRELTQRIVRQRPQMKDGKPVESNAPSLYRIIPEVWKLAAAKVDSKKVKEGNRPEGMLTQREMVKAQWHPAAHDVTLDLLRTRVFRALEHGMLRFSQPSAGVLPTRRFIPLAQEGLPEDTEHKVSVVEHFDIDVAFFLWLGDKGLSARAPQSLTSPPIHPSTCHNSNIRLVLCDTPTNSDLPLPQSPFYEHKKVYVPKWSHSDSTPLSNQGGISEQDLNLGIDRSNTPRTPPQQMQQFTPALIQVQVCNNNMTDPDPDPRRLPVFDIPYLLGESYMEKLHALSSRTPSVQRYLGLDRPDASGWVLVARPGMFHTQLMQELWRLWLYVGGWEWDEDCRKMEAERQLWQDGSNRRAAAAADTKAKRKAAVEIAVPDEPMR